MYVCLCFGVLKKGELISESLCRNWKVLNKRICADLTPNPILTPVLVKFDEAEVRTGLALCLQLLHNPQHDESSWSPSRVTITFHTNHRELKISPFR